MHIPPYSEIEANEILNRAIGIATGFLKDQRGFPPFCLAITVSGRRINQVPDTSITEDPAQLADMLRQEVRSSCARLRFRCVAFTRHVSVESESGELQPSIQITIEQLGPKHVTCYLPYQVTSSGEIQPGELYATEPVESFFPVDAPTPGA
jgi:hypothetical protein